jgi:hypothetical protein
MTPDSSMAIVLVPDVPTSTPSVTLTGNAPLTYRHRSEGEATLVSASGNGSTI